jgi:hypothetical protein
MRTLIHVVARGGHRQAYLDLLSSTFGASPVCGPIRGELRSQLVMADRLLLATLDDDIVGFTLLATERSLRGKATAALFLRPQSCFQRDVRSWSKAQLFRLLKKMPHLATITITPFSAAPHYASVAHAGVCDPQYWDFANRLKQAFQPTLLSEELVRRAAGRPIGCAMGRLASAKGIPFLAAILERSPQLRESMLWVCAGTVTDAERSLAERLMSAGIVVVDRFLSEAEIESLYGVTSAVWASYTPDYDQASGIFGRAMQLGVPAIVRRGSIIEHFARRHGVPVIAIAHDVPEVAGAEIEAYVSSRRQPSEVSAAHAALLKGWRDEFVTTVEAAMAGRGLANLG